MREYWHRVPRAFRPLVALAAVLALSAVIAACGGDDDDDDGDGAAAEGVGGPIAMMGPATGEAAEQGQEQFNWAELAIEQFNEENGTEFTLEEGDTQLDPGQASTVAQQFVSDDEILAVVGPAGSDGADAAGPIFTRANLGFVSQSATSTDLTNGDFPTFSRVVPPDSVQAPTDANYIAEQLGAENVLIVDDQTSYSTGLADPAQEELEAAGVEVSRESIGQKQADLSALVSKVTDETDVVFLPWQLAQRAQQFGEQMAEQGKDATIVGTDGLFSPDQFSIEGSVVSSFAPDIRGIPANEELVTAFEDQFGEFGTFGPPAYAAATVVMDAIVRASEDGEPTRESVAEAIRETDVPDSILGTPIRFDENGDIEGAEFSLFEVRPNGEFTLISEDDENEE